MGQRGPIPKPPELRLLEGRGTAPPVNLEALFRPEVGVPDSMPRWLTTEARKAWKRLSAELVQYNLLSRVDRDAFAMLCQTIGRCEILERSFVARQAALVDKGEDPALAYVDSTPNGMQVQSALYQVLNREQAKLHRLIESFGLRPDARARVTAGVRAQLKLFESDGAPAADAPREGPPRSFADF